MKLLLWWIVTEQRQVQQRAIPGLKTLDPTPSYAFCPVNRAQSNIAAAATAATMSCSSPVTSGGWHPAVHNYECPATPILPFMRGVSPFPVLIHKLVGRCTRWTERGGWLSWGQTQAYRAFQATLQTVLCAALRFRWERSRTPINGEVERERLEIGLFLLHIKIQKWCIRLNSY